MTGPPVAVREQQWRDAFANLDGSWFAHVLERPNGQLAGFSKGIVRPNPGDPGELNKLFLDREYQRLGLGTRLLGHVVRTFLERGITSMSAYVEPRNPSCWFFENLGGTWLRENGRVNFSWYIWSDLQTLAEGLPEA
jgi:GNAT superfamily N-acetyltransferase